MSVIECYSGLTFFMQILRSNSALIAKSPGGIQFGSAKLGSAFPVTLINFQSGIDISFANSKRAFLDALYSVKAVGPYSDPDAVASLASEIDDTLGGDEGLKHIDVTGGHVLNCHRESVLFYLDDTAGTRYGHMGGSYRIKNQQKPV